MPKPHDSDAGHEKPQAHAHPSSASALDSDLSETEIRTLQEWIREDLMKEIIKEYSSVPSRHSLHSGNEYVVDILHETLQWISERLIVSKHAFQLNGKTLHNIEACLPGDSRLGGIVIVSAHLDSTASEDGYRPQIDPAPGADDDASGIAGVLLTVRAIIAMSEIVGTPARREIRFVLFNAEEQERVGSIAYVRDARQWGADIVGVYQMDMIGYNKVEPSTFELHTGSPKITPGVGDESLALAHRIVRMCGAVSPELTAQVYHPQDSKPSSGRYFSDHTSFGRCPLTS